MQALDLLGNKVNMLLKKYAALEADNKRLRDTIARQDAAAKALQQQLSSLEHGMVSVHIGKGGGDEQEKENMRRQLDTVITEIDRILNTLND